MENCCPLVDYPNEKLFAEKIINLLSSEETYKELQRRALNRVKEYSSELIADSLGRMPIDRWIKPFRYLTLFQRLLSSKI